MKAAIYCRISSDKTGEQAGVTRQLEDCRALAASVDWTVVEEYTDNDISATSGRTRPAYQAMLAAIETGEIDAVIAWVPDRLYRKLRDLEPLIEIVERNGTRIRTVRAGEIDLTTPTGRLVARILGAVATAEGETKADRWLRSIRQRRENGQAPGWGPRLFGYAKTGEVIDGEAEQVRWAADEIIAGRSIRVVASELSIRGHTSTQGNPWSTQALTKLLKNPRLAGHSTLNGDIIGVGQWTPILTDEQYVQLQTVFAGRRATTPPAPRLSLLLGLARCSECRTPLKSARMAKKAGQTEGRRVYRCRKQPGSPACGKVTIGADDLEAMVETAAQTALDDPRVRAHIAALAATSGENAAEIIANEERLLELEAELDAPGVPVAAISRAMERTQERINELRGVPVVRSNALPSRGTWPSDLTRRARLVRLVVADVTVTPAPVVGRNAFQPGRVHITPH